METSGLTISNFPVITRWGTWLDLIRWIYENFSDILKFMEKLEEQFPNETNKRILDIFTINEFESSIRNVNFLNFVYKGIKELESETLSAEEQVKLF